MDDIIIKGVIKRLLGDLEQEKCYEYIERKKDLEIDWDKVRRYRAVIKRLPINELSANDVLQVLSEERPDLNDVIINHPDGRAWIAGQVEKIRQNLITKLKLPQKTAKAQAAS